MDRLGHILPFDIRDYRIVKCKGFTMVPNWFIEHSHFTVYEKMTAIVILKHQKNHQQAWPSHRHIAVQVCCSVSTVKKAIRQLEQKELLTSRHSANRKSKSYHINLDQKNQIFYKTEKSLKTGCQTVDKPAKLSTR